MMMALGFHLVLFRLIVVPLPFRGPVHELLPISAPMYSTKACYSAQLFIFNLNCRIGLAHKALPEQVNAMPYVRW